ncbi:right-handed parallel beta-helix repeat-containing protein [Aquibacillus albus]|uniref:Right handed beta helix domain-containing protein n=1 Tax=Aquibacillus albus TaxID=1168171 RepID=A0ABS2MWB7_9BACI|nr:right-handed parallel beta-helix repeat-containing protein [Aquibacillus albus]MBM7570162.1 hypothetical protein [Aquibacillus albus]
MGKVTKVSNRFFSLNKSIKRSILSAMDGDTIVIRKGTYEEDRALVIEKSIELTGNKQHVFIKSPIVIKNGAKVKMNGITLHHLEGYHNGIEILNGSLELEDSVIEHIKDRGIYVSQGGTLKVSKCRISENNCGIYSKGFVEIEQSTFSQHLDPQIFISGGSAVVRQSKIHSGKGNGLRVIEKGQLTMEDCLIHGHDEFSQISIEEGSSLELKNSKVYDGYEGIYVGSSTIEVEGSELAKHEIPHVKLINRSEMSLSKTKLKDGNGNGIQLIEESKGTIENCSVHGHMDYTHISLRDKSVLTVKNSKIYDGHGAFFVDDSKLELIESEVYNHQLTQLLLKNGSEMLAWKTRIMDGQGRGIQLGENSKGEIRDCIISGHRYYHQVVIANSSLQLAHTKIYDGLGAVSIKQSYIEIMDSEIYNHAEPQINAIHGTVMMDHSVVRNGKKVGMILRKKSIGVIQHCQFFENESYPQLFLDEHVKITMKDSTIYNGGSVGIFIRNHCKGKMENCSIYGHNKVEAQIMVKTSDHMQLKDLHITKGKVGIFLIDSSPTINFCEIEEHERGEIGINSNSNPEILNGDYELVTMQYQKN